MAQNTTINATAGAWTQLTSADVTSLTFQNIGGQYALIAGTLGATAPTNLNGALRYNPGQGERAVLISDLFPGVSGVNRAWVYADNGTRIFISHA